MTRFLCTLGLLISYAISAQTNFEKGSYTDNLGTTHSGYIKNLDWKDNPTAFEFSSTPDGRNSTTKTIREVQAFKIDGLSQYIRELANIDQSPQDVATLNYDRNPEVSLETVFLKVMMDGETRLYRYREGKHLSLFFINKAGLIELLVYKRFLNVEKDIVENNYFKQQLLNQFSCDKGKMPDVASLRYTTSDILSYLRKYNDCMGIEQAEVKQQERGPRFGLTVFGGPNYNSYSVKEVPQNFDYGSGTTPTYGFEIEYTLPTNNDKWAIFMDARTMKFSANTTFTIPAGLGTSTITQTTEFRYKALEIAAGVRHYFYLGGKSRLFVSLNYAAEANSSSTIDNARSRDIEVAIPVGTYGIGFGYNYGNLRIEARHNGTKDHFSKGKSSGRSTYTSFMLTLGYTFARF